MEDLAGLVMQSDFQTLLLALAAGLLALVLLWRLASAPRGNLVLILGAPGAGKTTLFHQLRDGSTHLGTVPSMQPNQDAALLKPDKEGGAGKAVELVDVPGHPKVRGMAARFYGKACKIVFLVDAVEFMGNKTDVAEQLYEVLADRTVQRRRLPVLLACNKTDQGARAHTPEFVRKRLEKELEGLRGTRGTLGEAGEQQLALARPGEPFAFAGLRSPPVQLASTAALTGDLGEVLRFLQ